MIIHRPRPGSIDLWDIWSHWGPYCRRVATIPENDVPAPIRVQWDRDREVAALIAEEEAIEARVWRGLR